MFHTGVYREKHDKKFLSETKKPRALIFVMQHHLMNIYKLCSCGQKWPRQAVTCFTKAYIEKYEKIFLSETARPRTLIFGM